MVLSSHSDCYDFVKMGDFCYSFCNGKEWANCGDMHDIETLREMDRVA